jgi:hypothetical protein
VGAVCLRSICGGSHGSPQPRKLHDCRRNAARVSIDGLHPAAMDAVLSAADQTGAARKNRSLQLFARLKTGVTLEQARAEIVALAHRAAETFPETEKGWVAAVRTLPDFLVHDFGIRAALAVLMTTVAFVLKIACANVVGLLLARCGTPERAGHPHLARCRTSADYPSIVNRRAGHRSCRRLRRAIAVDLGYQVSAGQFELRRSGGHYAGPKCLVLRDGYFAGIRGAM